MIMPRFPQRRPREVAAYPIRYAMGEPPAVGTNVRARLDTRTGIPEMWEGVARGGRQLASAGFEIMDKIQAAEDSTEYDKAVRADKERWNAYTQLLTTAADPDEIKAGYEEYVKESSAAPSDRANVNRSYQQYWDKAAPVREAKYLAAFRELKIKRVSSVHEENDISDYERADKENFLKRQEKAVKLGIITPEQAEILENSFDDISKLYQMNRAIEMGNVQAAFKIAETIDKSKLTTKQLGVMNDNLAAAKRQNEIDTDEAIVAILKNLQENKGASPVTKLSIRNESIQQLGLIPGISDQEYRVNVKYIEDWAKGAESRSDPYSQELISDLIGEVSDISSAEDLGYVESQLRQQRHKLKPSDYLAFKDDLRRIIKKAQSDAIESVIDTYELKIRTRNVPEFRRAMRVWVAEQDKPPGPREVYIHASEEAVMWRKREDEERKAMASGPALQRSEAKVADRATAWEIFLEAGGDPEKARMIAAERGYIIPESGAAK